MINQTLFARFYAIVLVPAGTACASSPSGRLSLCLLSLLDIAWLEAGAPTLPRIFYGQQNEQRIHPQQIK